MTTKLQKKVDAAQYLLQAVAKKHDDIELAYSGGKDSDVILELARMSGIPFTPMYRNTTIDPPGTIKHVLSKGVQIVRARETFFHIIERKGFPSRTARFCCDYLKEYKIKDTCIVGIRREESVKRAANYREPEMCRIYPHGGKVSQVLPILDWTLEDVREFVEARDIRLHPMYYRPDGTIDYARRLGCMACPLAFHNGLNDFVAHPKLVRAWLRAGLVWWNREREKPLVSHSRFSDIYECFAFHIAWDSRRHFTLNKDALFPTDWKLVLENNFGIDLTFNK